MEDRGKPAFEDVAPFIENLLHVKIHGVNWFSTYRVHHRVAGKFRKGRVFILGDAGHIHSPVGGQGMNTGIGDAVNLAWKLAAVLHGRANEAVLDSYETERRAFARQLVNTTDKAFHAIIGQNLTGRLVRTVLIPHVAPFLLGFSTVKKAAFNTVSQIRIHYRDSALSVERPGSFKVGTVSLGSAVMGLITSRRSYPLIGRFTSMVRQPRRCVKLRENTTLHCMSLNGTRPAGRRDFCAIPSTLYGRMDT